MVKMGFAFIIFLGLIGLNSDLKAHDAQTFISKKGGKSEGKVAQKKDDKKADNKKDKKKDKKEDKKEEDKDEPPKIGNFALPTAQQPGSLLAFGYNMLDKDQSQLEILSDLFVGNERHSSDILPSFLYAFSEKFSLYAVVPFAPSYRIGPYHSSGLEDAFLQGEYAFYTKENKRRSDQATLVLNVSLPTGGTIKNPLTGNGAMAFFSGLTFQRLYVDYFGYTSQGFLYPTAHHGFQTGWSYLYQFGFGKCLAYKTDRWIFAGQVELGGDYSAKNTYKGITLEDTGGNVIFVTPSLWYSKRRLILQFGVGFPILQDLNGDQINFDYAWVFDIRYTFGKFAD